MSTIEPLLTPIQERLEAATDGPWRWDEKFGDEGDTGLALTNDAGAEIVSAYNHHCCSFRDDPLVEDNDAVFIASAPTDMARLLAAVEAVMVECDQMDEVVAIRSGVPTSKSWQANRIRSAVTTALGGDK